jgi:hypothetical protein
VSGDAFGLGYGHGIKDALATIEAATWLKRKDREHLKAAVREKASGEDRPAMPNEFEAMHGGEDGWTEWIHPLEPYFMQCCDCGLVHEAEFRIIKDKIRKPDGTWDAVYTSDPLLEVIFRMRRPR